MSCCSGLANVLKKVFNALKPLLTVALLCAAAYFLFLAPATATLGSTLGSLSWMPTVIAESTLAASTVGYIALGAAVLVDPEGIGELAGSAAQTIGKVAGSVVAGLAGGVAGGLFGGNFLGFAALGALAWFLFFRKDDDGETVSERAGWTDTKAIRDKKREAAADREISMTKGAVSG